MWVVEPVRRHVSSHGAVCWSSTSVDARSKRGLLMRINVVCFLALLRCGMVCSSAKMANSEIPASALARRLLPNKKERMAVTRYKAALILLQSG